MGSSAENHQGKNEQKSWCHTMAPGSKYQLDDSEIESMPNRS